MGFIEYINLSSRIRALQSLNKFPNTTEVANPIWCPIEGSIPPWVNGILYRTGPGKYNLGDDKKKQYVIQHAFDGLPFVHRFELSSERQAVRYNNRLISDAVERRLVADPNANEIFFGHIPNLSTWRSFTNLLGRIAGMATSTRKSEMDPSDDTVGVTVTPNFPLPSKFGSVANSDNDHVLVTKTDANILQQVHSNTLEPKRLFDYGEYDERLDGILSAAHHQRDPKTEDIFNFSINFGRNPAMKVFRIDSTGKETQVLATIRERLLPEGQRSTYLPAYVHSFWLTENYVIIPESPLHYANNGVDVLVHGAVATAMAWKEDSPAYLHIISRDPSIGHVVSLPVDPFFTFHTGNAWDSLDSDGNPVIDMDCCAFSNGDILYQINRYGDMERFAGEYKKAHNGSYPNGAGKQRNISLAGGPFQFGDLRRYRATWSKNTGKATCRVIAKNMEFPRFAPQLACQKTRYLWGCQHEDATATHSERFSLIKVDTETGDVIKYDRESTMFSEPVFVPNPRSKTGDEDDGALLSFANVFDPRGPSYDRCILSIVNASTMQEIGRCNIGQFVTNTFHGSYVDVDFVSVAIN
ncbi:carotenoid oxygenase [Zychaea mexicana]|uniref:carotenoid oxygenase n=1 Tax=Zychaea mexicana TaxID=64656 RepID=UPI0022FE5BC9|nr:carotenoid oxygenase [Zychaea mexicana]KAI9490811.1 carotenoid oxygenase [Zychaea mexicana]